MYVFILLPKTSINCINQTRYSTIGQPIEYQKHLYPLNIV